MRLGEIEAIPTPSVFQQPQRYSTHLDQFDSPVTPSDSRSRRIISQGSSLGVPPSSDAARSSFMTNTSGISRLSDFPAPPSQITPSHLSILHAYYGDGTRRDSEADFESVRPTLTRETSHTTFGGQMGEAL